MLGAAFLGLFVLTGLIAAIIGGVVILGIGVVGAFKDIAAYGKRLRFLKQETQASQQRMQDAAYAQQLRDLHYGEKPTKK